VRYAECLYAEYRYAECHYAECHYAECHGDQIGIYPHSGLAANIRLGCRYLPLINDEAYKSKVQQYIKRFLTLVHDQKVRFESSQVKPVIFFQTAIVLEELSYISYDQLRTMFGQGTLTEGKSPLRLTSSLRLIIL
jgi:hypothetical protein